MKIAVLHQGYIGSENEGPPEEYVQNNIDRTFYLLRKAGAAGADIAVTNEDFGGIGAYMRDMARMSLFGDLVAKLEGQIIEKLCEIAGDYRMYIAANEYETDAGGVYNTTKLIGRDGEIVGKYRKVHLPAGERFKVQPGAAYPVFKTELGNIGVAVCYDMLFPEHCRILAMNGADLIVHQSQGWFPGGHNKNVLGEPFVRVRAAENRVYMIVAKNIQDDGGMSCVIDFYGNVLASQGGLQENILLTDIEPDYDAVDEYDYDNNYSGVKSLRARHLLHREPATYGRLVEGYPVFNSDLLSGERLYTFNEWVENIKAMDVMPEPEKAKLHW